jgi:hypothetical protein
MRMDNIFRKYGVTRGEYESEYDKQDGMCKVCGKHDLALQVDMSMRTRKMRGLVCGNCRKAIGLIGGDAYVAKKLWKHLGGEE